MPAVFLGAELVQGDCTTAPLDHLGKLLARLPPDSMHFPTTATDAGRNVACFAFDASVPASSCVSLM